jgi:hypothetical protein
MSEILHIILAQMFSMIAATFEAAISAHATINKFTSDAKEAAWQESEAKSWERKEFGAGKACSQSEMSVAP